MDMLKISEWQRLTTLTALNLIRVVENKRSLNHYKGFKGSGMRFKASIDTLIQNYITYRMMEIIVPGVNPVIVEEIIDYVTKNAGIFESI